MYYGNPINNLIENLKKLPGIGAKSAQRLAFYIINMPEDKINILANSMIEAKQKIKYCKKCQNFSDNDLCFICSNTNRIQDTIMVVETPKDMAAYEKTNEFKGVYHILHGAMSPIQNISPDDIKIKELVSRVTYNKIFEIIIATNSNVEGEATAMYINKLLKPFQIKITRIAHGVPVGGDIEFVDELTLCRALEGRREI